MNIFSSNGGKYISHEFSGKYFFFCSLLYNTQLLWLCQTTRTHANKSRLKNYPVTIYEEWNELYTVKGVFGLSNIIRLGNKNRLRVCSVLWNIDCVSSMKIKWKWGKLYAFFFWKMPSLRVPNCLPTSKAKTK